MGLVSEGEKLHGLTQSLESPADTWYRRLLRRPEVQLLPILALLVLATYALPEREGDESGYLGLARNLLDGAYAKGPPDALLDNDQTYPDLWFGPGLPLVLAGPVAAGLPLELIRLVGPLVVFLALIVFFHLLRRHVSSRAALVATSALGLYAPVYAALPQLHSEPLAMFFVVLSLYATARLYERDSLAWVAVGGAALAGLALTRVEYGWVLTIGLGVFAAAWALGRSRRARSLALMYALGLAMCIPWLAYTTAETGRVLQWGNSGGLSLYWMSSPYPGDLGDWQKAEKVSSDPNLAPHRPFFAELKGLTLPEQNAKLERKALDNVRDHPVKFLENVAANVSRMLFDTPYSYSEQRLTALFYARPDALLLGAALLAAIVAFQCRRAFAAPAAPFAIFAAVAFGIHVVAAAYPRMLIPIVPVVVWFTAVAVANHLQLVRRPASTMPTDDVGR